jgi:hypothetical protein
MANSVEVVLSSALLLRVLDEKSLPDTKRDEAMEALMGNRVEAKCTGDGAVELALRKCQTSDHGYSAAEARECYSECSLS